MNTNEIFNNVKEDICTKYWNTDLNHQYIVSGDTDSFFIEFSTLCKYPENEEGYKQFSETYAKDLEELINQKLLREYLPSIMNWDPNRVELLLEYEASGVTYNLPAKKKYAFYTQHPKVKLDVKGLETERSDYPERTREKLLELLKQIVIERKSQQELLDFAKQVYDEFKQDIEDWDVSLAKPVSFSKHLKEYKKVPAAVIGMLIWNHLTGSEDFRPGSKGLSFKIFVHERKIPEKLYKDLISIVEEHSKSNTIDWLVVPADITKEQLKETFKSISEKYSIDFETTFVIDVDYMVSFAWVDRVNILFEGLNIKFEPNPKKQENNSQDLLWNL